MTAALDLADATVTFDPRFLRDADATLAALVAQIPWRTDTITLYGKTHPIPRLHQWFADNAATYTYSRITLHPAPWPPALMAVRERLEHHLGGPFPTCLANLYRTGHDSNGWHADDEPELGDQPVIASVSLGATRTFRLRHRASRHTVSLDLPHGSLLVMAGTTQVHWEHCLPKRLRVTAPRLNLTFRRPGTRP